MSVQEQEPRELILTIFTPTYNRGDLLPRLFESIESQINQYHAVEWLVIDDGSTDNTPLLMQGLQRSHSGWVRYFRVQNGGKHRAINFAASMAYGRWIMIVDSDDMLADNSIASVLFHISKIETDTKIGLLRGLKCFPEIRVAHAFCVPKNPCSHSEWLTKQKAFDSAEVIRKSALLKCKFPEIEGERFVAEGWLWHSLEKLYLTQYVNEPWVTCFYQTEGLSANSRRIRSTAPRGAMAVYHAMLSSPIPIGLRIRTSINWWRYYFHAMARNPMPTVELMPSRCLAPVGWLLFKQDTFLLK